MRGEGESREHTSKLLHAVDLHEGPAFDLHALSRRSFLAGSGTTCPVRSGQRRGTYKGDGTRRKVWSGRH